MDASRRLLWGVGDVLLSESCGHNGWKGNFQGLWNWNWEKSQAGGGSRRSGRGTRQGRLSFLEQKGLDRPIPPSVGEGGGFSLGRRRSTALPDSQRGSYQFTVWPLVSETPGFKSRFLPLVTAPVSKFSEAQFPHLPSRDNDAFLRGLGCGESLAQ